MLVIAASATAEGLSWRGRRHDDDGAGVSCGDSVDALFDSVFTALHDGEQVAVGFAGVLQGAEGDDVSSSGVLRRLEELLTELGRWRPWTVVSTSLPRWRATTSVLVWEADAPSSASAGELDDCVEAFYDLVRERGEGDTGAMAATGVGGLVNLAATAALSAGLTVDHSQLDEPVVRVRRPAAPTIS